MFYDVAKIDVGRMCPISHEDSGTDPAVHQFKVRIVFDLPNQLDEVTVAQAAGVMDRHFEIILVMERICVSF